MAEAASDKATEASARPSKPYSGQRKKRINRGQYCCVPMCNVYQNDTDGNKVEDVHFITFPTDSTERKKWCHLIKRQDGRDDFKVTKSTRVCNKHFKDDEFEKTLTGKWRRCPNTAPSIFAWMASKPERKPPTNRIMKTKHHKVMVEDDGHECIETLDSPMNTDEYPPTWTMLSNLSTDSLEHDYSISSLPVADDISIIGSLQDQICDMQKTMTALRIENKDLAVSLQDCTNRIFTIEKYKDDNSAITFYTGFPDYNTLYSFFTYLQPKLYGLQPWQEAKTKDKMAYQADGKRKPGPSPKLDHFDQYILVLMRLKIGLFTQDLADRFGISDSLVSTIFTKWLNLLHCELPLLFPFPSQKLVRMNMPKEFSEYPTTRVIIDCTEIFSEVPSTLTPQAEMWSNYKHHNTWKVLVGVTPNGLVSFVSELWGGRVSDKEVTKKSGLLELLDFGDNVMADRGFEIQDILPPGVKLDIPPFKGERAQLSGVERDEAARIAAVRIHVERAIARIKNYHILDGIMPLSLQPTAWQIFAVCSYLTNFCPPLLKSPVNPAQDSESHGDITDTCDCKQHPAISISVNINK